MGILNKFFSFTVILVIFLSYFFSPFSSYLTDSRIQSLDYLSFPLSLFSKFYEYIGAVLNLDNILERNEKLHNQVSALKFELSNLDSIKTENKKLRRLLQIKKKTNFDYVAAEIIARDNPEFSNVVILNKGVESGIVLNNFIISEGVLVGKIVEVGSENSKAILANDVNFKVGAKIKSTGDIGLVVGGMKNNICYMKYLPNDANIKIGDMVVSYGYNKFLPSGIPIGKVKSFIPSEGEFFKKAVLASYVDFHSMRFVLCLKQN